MLIALPGVPGETAVYVSPVWTRAEADPSVREATAPGEAPFKVTLPEPEITPEIVTELGSLKTKLPLSEIARDMVELLALV